MKPQRDNRILKKPAPLLISIQFNSFKQRNTYTTITTTTTTATTTTTTNNNNKLFCALILKTALYTPRIVSTEELRHCMP
jgi:hypothetical protein